MKSKSKKLRPKRISLNERDAAHAYEWLRMYWQNGEAGKFGGCALCTQIGKRLEVFIGPAEVRSIARAVNKHPVCNAA